MLHKIQNQFQLNNIIKIMTDLNSKDKEFTVEISQKNTATRQQQKYYWGLIIPCIIEWNTECGIFSYTEKCIDEESGNEYDVDVVIRDKDIIDDILRQRFYFKTIKVGDKDVKVKKTLNLTKSNRSEVIGYFDTVIEYMAQRDCYIPLPDEDNSWYYEDKTWTQENES